MTVYYFVVVLVLVLGILAQYVNRRLPVKEVVMPNGSIAKKNNYSIFYFLLIFIFIFVGGFRYYVGTDYGGYYKLYNFTWDEILDFFKELDEPLLKLVSYLARMVWDDGVCVILVSCTIITLFTFYAFSKYDDNEITLLLLFYIFTGAWTFSFNGIRQAFACAIVFAVTSTIDKYYLGYKGLFRIVLGCLIAYLVHKSAILLIPIILISRRKIDTKQFFMILACAALIPLLFDNAFNVMEVDLENQDALEYINHEINPIRVAVAIAPLALLIFIPDRREFFDSERFIVNMEFFHVVLNITTMNSAYMNRITQYSVYFTIIFIVKALRRIRGNMRLVIIASTVLLYFIYWKYGMNTSESMVPFSWSFRHFGEF